MVLEADRAPSAVAMTRAMAEAIDCARKVHVGMCAARNITHTGAIGYFALQAAEAGFIGIAMSASGPMMAYPGTRVPAVSSNPIAFAVPRRNGRPYLLDFSTGVVANGKIMGAADRGEKFRSAGVSTRTATTPPIRRRSRRCCRSAAPRARACRS